MLSSNSIVDKGSSHFGFFFKSRSLKTGKVIGQALVCYEGRRQGKKSGLLGKK